MLVFPSLFFPNTPTTPESFENDENLAMIQKLFPVLPTNRDLSIPSSKVKELSGKVKEVLLEEVTQEDMEQLDFEEEESEKDSDSDSDESGSDDSSSHS